MALIKCRECNNLISDQAASCPKCGMPLHSIKEAPQESDGQTVKKRPSGCLSVIACAVFLVVVIIAVVGWSTSGSSPTPAPASQETCANNWEKCTDNADLVNNYTGWQNIQTACEQAVDKQVRYGDPKWPGPFGAAGFDSFYKGNDYVSSGIATAIEPDVQIENAFGAMVHSRAVCHFDLNKKTVLDVNWAPD